MASPIGHSLLGLALCRFQVPSESMSPRVWYLLSAVAASAADLDVLPGLLVGDLNRFHRGISHSLLACVLFGAAVWLAARLAGKPGLRVGLMGGLLYASHLLLDLFTSDGRAPYGSPLFWPLSEQHFISPWTFFGGFRHGVPGDDFPEVVRHLLSWENLGVIALEALVLLPVVALFWQLKRLKAVALSKRGPSQAPGGGADPQI